MECLLLANMKMNHADSRMDEAKLKDVLLNPYKVESKDTAALITHSSCESKSKDHILAHNQQEILSVDIDDGIYTDMQELQKELSDLNVGSYCIYTTASHSPSEGKYKFRVVIPLKEPITCDQFTLAQLALCKIFKSDEVVSRIQQILYLPMSQKGYEYIDALTGTGFDINDSEKLKSEIINVNNKRLQKEAEKEAEQQKLATARAARKLQIQSTGGEKLESVFDIVEQQYTMRELLANYGFKLKGSRYLHPSSSSGLAGVIILEDGKYFSHHSENSDPLANGKSHSCFDLIKYWEYDNDQEKAIEGLSKELMVNGQTLYDYNESIKKGNLEGEIKKHNDEMHSNLMALESMAHEEAESMAVNAALDGDLPSDSYEPNLLGDPADDEDEHAINQLAEQAQTNAITTLNNQAVEIDVDSDEIINFDEHTQIMPTKKMNFDMLKPTGLVEKIIEEICIRMHRSDPALAVAPALYIAMRAGLPTIENSRLSDDYDIKRYGAGLNGFKIYLNLLTVGISASGKDKPQQLLNSTLNFLGDETYGRIASDKDLAVSLIDSMGSACCVIDEAGGMFSSIQDGGAAGYMKNLAGAMMQYATSKHSNFDGLIKRGLRKDYQATLAAATRSMDNVDAETPEEEARIKESIKKDIDMLKWKVDACHDGIKMPQFAILASSTPTDMKGAINLATLNTGQMSRYLMFVGKSDVDVLREKVEGIDYDSLSEGILNKLWWVKSNAHTSDDYALRSNAHNTYRYIGKWFESRRNHTELSVLYRRGFETVVRLASIIAFEDKVVTIEHLEWAFCLVRSNIESFAITCATENESTSDDTKLMLAILSTLKSTKDGMYISALKQRFKRKKEWDPVMPFFERCIEILTNDGFVALDGKTLKFTGKNSIDRT